VTQRLLDAACQQFYSNHIKCNFFDASIDTSLFRGSVRSTKWMCKPDSLRWYTWSWSSISADACIVNQYMQRCWLTIKPDCVRHHCGNSNNKKENIALTFGRVKHCDFFPFRQSHFVSLLPFRRFACTVRSKAASWLLNRWRCRPGQWIPKKTGFIFKFTENIYKKNIFHKPSEINFLVVVSQGIRRCCGHEVRVLFSRIGRQVPGFISEIALFLGILTWLRG